LFGLTDLGNTNFGQFGSEKDPHRHLQPPWMNQNATWKQDEAVDFLPELREIRSRIMGTNLWIVGMPGSGKTTLGRMLAEGLGYRWLDLDAQIEQMIGKTASRCFEEDGEAVWRKQETKLCGALQSYVQTVVSTGGGIMTTKENLPLLHTGLIVWLDLPADAIVKRLEEAGEVDKRPLLKQASDPVEALMKLYNERQKHYKLADVRVQVREQDTPVRVLRRVSHRIIEELDLRPPKARAWEEKRHKMKQMWNMMKAQGQGVNINSIPDMEEETGQRGPDYSAELIKAKPPEGAGEGPEDDAPAVGSQGSGFGLGMDDYLGGSPQKSAEI
jgi:shikimate kinase